MHDERDSNGAPGVDGKCLSTKHMRGRLWWVHAAGLGKVTGSTCFTSRYPDTCEKRLPGDIFLVWLFRALREARECLYDYDE